MNGLTGQHFTVQNEGGKQLDKAILDQYIQLKKEAKDLEKRIERLNNQVDNVEYGTVKGSSKSFPYTERTFRVSGYNICNLEKRNSKIKQLNIIYEKKLDESMDMVVEIEEYINDIQDSGLRQIFRYKYIDNLTWEEIGRKLYIDRTTAEKRVSKYLEFS